MIGIITFHAAYNYGSVLQAYATQTTLTKLGFESEIINYRTNNQIHYYKDIFTLKFGLKETIRRLGWLKESKARNARSRKFESFINEELKLSGPILCTFEDVKRANFNYSALLAGSDQIWNRHCVAEFMTEPNNAILPYFLDFQHDVTCRRVSFSSSFGTMSKDEIKDSATLLKRFDFIALREKDAADELSKILDVPVQNTVDPTLLLSKEDWLNVFQDKLYTTNDEYILLYTLVKSPSVFKKNIEIVKRFAGNKKIICIAPFNTYFGNNVIMRNDSGPYDFLALVNGADFVITDSFHGTAFSVNLGKNFISINNGKDKRKSQLLNRVGLENRLLDGYDDLIDYREDKNCDYSNASMLLTEAREYSIGYLKKALI